MEFNIKTDRTVPPGTVIMKNDDGVEVGRIVNIGSGEDMSWEYRIIKWMFRGANRFEIGKVFYDEKGLVKSWTNRGLDFDGDSVEDLKRHMRILAQAFEKPVMVEDGIGKLKLREEKAS